MATTVSPDCPAVRVTSPVVMGGLKTSRDVRCRVETQVAVWLALVRRLLRACDARIVTLRGGSRRGSVRHRAARTAGDRHLHATDAGIEGARRRCS